MPATSPIKIAPSILSADFGRIGEQVAEAARAGADYIHVDVMDGHFVPNLTIGPLVVRAIGRWTDIPLDVHMMVEQPQSFVDELVAAGADIITVHAEAPIHLHRVVHQIRDAGKRPGVSLNPATPISAVEEVLPDLDLVLIMTVNPGFGGQAFIKGMVDKVGRMRAVLDRSGSSAELEVDGGINAETASAVVQAGARVLVAGSAVYNDSVSVAEGIAAIRDSLR